jgi:hypothetical protein
MKRATIQQAVNPCHLSHHSLQLCKADLAAAAAAAAVQAKYCVDEVHFVSDMSAVLGATQPPCLHLLAGTNTDRCVTVLWSPADSTVCWCEQFTLARLSQLNTLH